MNTMSEAETVSETDSVSEADSESVEADGTGETVSAGPADGGDGGCYGGDASSVSPTGGDSVSSVSPAGGGGLSGVGDGVGLLTNGNFVGVSGKSEGDAASEDVPGAFSVLLDQLSVLGESDVSGVEGDGEGVGVDSDDGGGGASREGQQNDC
uniref:Uncharacterized protein n=1 Tax=Lygus hesperus TaxID=30085 RepID=A0A0A9X1M5_LYGHE